MRLLRAFLLGAAAAGALAYAAATTLALAVAASGGAVSISAGPIAVVAVEQTTDGNATTLGPGLVLVALAGGVVNAVAAAVLVRRSR